MVTQAEIIPIVIIHDLSPISKYHITIFDKKKMNGKIIGILLPAISSLDMSFTLFTVHNVGKNITF